MTVARTVPTLTFVCAVATAGTTIAMRINNRRYIGTSPPMVLYYAEAVRNSAAPAPATPEHCGHPAFYLPGWRTLADRVRKRQPDLHRSAMSLKANPWI